MSPIQRYVSAALHELVRKTQQRRSLIRTHLCRANRVQFALNYVGARCDDGVNCAPRRVNLSARLTQCVLISWQLSLHRCKHTQHVVGLLLQTERLVAHLQAVEQRSHGARPSHVNAILARKRFHQARRAHHLGVKPFKRQEHDAKVGSLRHA